MVVFDNAAVGNAEGVMEIFCTLLAGKLYLGDRWMYSLQSLPQQGDLPLAGKDFPQQYGLIKAPATQAADMQRNRHQKIRLLPGYKVSQQFCGQQAEGEPQVRFVIVLETVNQVTAGTFIPQGCPGCSIGRGILQATAAGVIRTCTVKWNAAECCRRETP
jgi:hypothetical protein